MDIFKRIGKGIQALSNEITKPDSFVKGEEFEEYVRQVIFPKERYDLIHRSHKYEDNKDDYIETSLLPDFKFRCKECKKEFSVEVKFRNGTYFKNKIEWCKPFQLKRYKQLDSPQNPIFLVLGLGDKPTKPNEIFIIPIAKIEYTSFYDSFLDKYSFYLEKPVFSNYLWSLQK